MMETRWGINLPLHPQGVAAEISIKQTPRKGELTFRNTTTCEVINIKVGIIVAPPVSSANGQSMKVHIFNEFLEVDIERERATFSISMNRSSAQAISLNQHIACNKAQRILISGAAAMELRVGKKLVFASNLDPDTLCGDVEDLSFGQQILSKLQAIVDAAGGGEFRLTGDDIDSQIGMIDYLYNLIMAPASVKVSPVKLVPTGNFPLDLFEAEALLLGRLAFNTAAIAFGAIGIAKISGGSDLKTLQISRLNVRPDFHTCQRVPAKDPLNSATFFAPATGCGAKW
jgi:hypothetical protein